MAVVMLSVSSRVEVVERTTEGPPLHPSSAHAHSMVSLADPVMLRHPVQ